MAKPPPPAIASIDDALAQAYAIKTKLRDDEDMPALKARVKGKGFGQAQLIAKREALALVEDRCIVSRIHRSFLDDVIGS